MTACEDWEGAADEVVDLGGGPEIGPILRAGKRWPDLEPLLIRVLK
jgi:hypothetical protein